MAGRHALVVPALKKHTATIIMAHGLGDRWASVSLAVYEADLTSTAVRDGECVRGSLRSDAERLKGVSCGVMATTRQVRGHQVHLSERTEYTHHSGKEEASLRTGVETGTDSWFQNMGMSMPGWYDIVRRRDDVCNPPAQPPAVFQC
jgi:hypothetical protein